MEVLVFPIGVGRGGSRHMLLRILCVAFLALFAFALFVHATPAEAKGPPPVPRINILEEGATVEQDGDLIIVTARGMAPARVQAEIYKAEQPVPPAKTDQWSLEGDKWAISRATILISDLPNGHYVLRVTIIHPDGTTWADDFDIVKTD